MQSLQNKTQKQNSQNETSVKIEPSVKVNGVLNYASRSIETNIIPNVKSENPENVIIHLFSVIMCKVKLKLSK